MLFAGYRTVCHVFDIPVTKAEVYMSDPGLQPERTLLSWGRTACSFFTVAILFFRYGAVLSNPLYYLPGALLCLAGSSHLLINKTQRFYPQGTGRQEGLTRKHLAIAMFSFSVFFASILFLIECF